MITRAITGREIDLAAELPRWVSVRYPGFARKESSLTRRGKLRRLPAKFAGLARCRVCGEWLTFAESGWICGDVHCTGSPLIPDAELAARVPTRTRFRMAALAFRRLAQPELASRVQS